MVLETFALLLALCAALGLPRIGNHWFIRAEYALGRFAQRRHLVIAVIGLVPLVLRILLLPIQPIPEPYIHDEFTHLFAAETFAEGRLSNPTHPLWEHFETMYIHHQPTYMAKYFPGQAFLLAVGKVVFGHPWFGVWLSAGLMCAAICWMLQGWLPPRWALFGGFLAVVRLGIVGNWVNSYWGGALAASGGALVFGALPRIKRFPRLPYVFALLAGVALLANTRPYEGLLVSIPVAAALLHWMSRRSSLPRGVLLRRLVLPAVFWFAALASAMGYYNWRVFGHPLTLPYTLYRATYGMGPVFLWQPTLTERSFRHEIMQNAYEMIFLNISRSFHTVAGYFEIELGNAFLAVFFVVGFTLLPALAGLPRAVMDRRVRLLVPSALLLAVGLAPNAHFAPHHLGPAIAVLYALLIQAMRHLRTWRTPGGASGVFLIRAMAITLLIAFGARAVLERDSRGVARANMAAALSASGRHLAIVRYDSRHDPREEWVYNAPDIDRSAVVWAHHMGEDKNAELIRYFRDRTVWLVEPDARPPRVSPYHEALRRPGQAGDRLANTTATSSE